MKILCLGDSYTIGEMVPVYNSFPNQLVASLRKLEKSVLELKVIAKTGWTTDELIGPMETQVLHKEYNLVTVLIGVNNQYRNRSTKEYEIHFHYILNRAIAYANNIAANVIVLSIPDWGLTPFNTERDKTQTSKEIDAYNAINKSIALSNNCKYINITESTRINATNADFLAMDGLHPSGREYEIWSEKIVREIEK
jgi:lysophospholipase L1-like esterase